MAKSNVLPKGYATEELLRSYFLKAGYYVVRGVPFRYEGFDVTDIDLWLYSRASSVSREVTIVDIKFKKTPQAIERIFWIQGLKLATKANSAIVATTERRSEVKDFGKDLDVTVLDGSFLARLGPKEGPNPSRLSDEEFQELLNTYTLGKLDGDWKNRIKHCKSLLAKGLSFDNCNEWLGQAHFFAECAISNLPQRDKALRCLYLVCSFIAIGVDYLLKDLSFVEQIERTALLSDGFTFGTRGKSGLGKMIEVALGLVSEHAIDGQDVSRRVRTSIEEQLKSLNVDVLAHFFAKPEVGRTLFQTGREFEALAMQRVTPDHTDSSTELRSMLYCLIDHWNIDRTVFNSKQRHLFSH